LEVIDSGIGISGEQQANLFQPFVQADGSTTRKYGGTGLGLSIAHNLVKLMGGEIGFVSRPGAGSTFWFEVPLEVRRMANSADRTFLHGRRVLIVDDNRTNREILTNLLRSWQMAPAEAAGAGEGIELLLAAQREGEPFDIAIVDMQMPEVDGISFARHVKAASALKGVAMILLTSLGQRSLCKSLVSSGFSACLCKPVRESQLLLTLERVTSENPIPPRSLPPTDEPARDSLPVEAQSGERQGRILIADDNRVNQKIAGHFVRQLGYSVRMVGNGLDAVEAVKSGAFELVLMDCHMPEMDGFDATATIRRLDCAMRDVPIVAVTANAMNGDRERCLAAGMNDYLSKPFRPQELKALIERYVGVRGGG
jgi:CheY-like chemotaxis protein